MLQHGPQEHEAGGYDSRARVEAEAQAPPVAALTVDSGPYMQAQPTVDSHLVAFRRLALRRRRMRVALGACLATMFFALFVMNPLVTRLRSQQTQLLHRELDRQHEMVVAIAEVNRLTAVLDQADRDDIAGGGSSRRTPRNRALEQRLKQARARSAELETPSPFTAERDRLDAKIEPIELTTTGLSMIAILGLVVVCLLGAGIEWRQRKHVRAMAGADDLRIIGPLAEALAPVEPKEQSIAQTMLGAFAFRGAFSTDPVISNARQRNSVVSTLTALLPRLQQADSALLDDYHWRCLAGVLENAQVDRDVALIVALIEAFTRMGDGRILGVVDGLTRLKGDAQPRQQIKAAASAALPLLRQYAEQGRLSASLLRASDGSASAPASLLRPVRDASPDTNRSDELLRPESGEIER